MGHLTIRTRPEEGAQGLARRLIERAPALECMVCGGKDFALLEEPKGEYRTYLRRYHSPNGPSPGKATLNQKLLTLICTNCGHLEQFAEAILDGAKPEEYGVEVQNG